MVAEGKVTTDPRLIERWVSARDGWPAIRQKFTDDGVENTLSIVFPGDETGEAVYRLSWEEFFEQFEKQEFVFLFEEVTDKKKPESCYALV